MNDKDLNTPDQKKPKKSNKISIFERLFKEGQQRDEVLNLFE